MQSYKNHVRWNVGHQLIFLPGALILFVISIIKLVGSIRTANDQMWLWLVLTLFIGLTGWFSMVVRAGYGLTLQNRLILHEENFRYYRLTGKLLKEDYPNLQDGQIYALRFAPDEEYLDLLQKTAEENLTADQIKQSVKNWKADYKRV